MSRIPHHIVECSEPLLWVEKSRDSTGLVHVPGKDEIVAVHKPAGVGVYRGEADPSVPEVLKKNWEQQQPDGTTPIVLTVKFNCPDRRAHTHGYACFVPSDQGWEKLHKLGAEVVPA